MFALVRCLEVFLQKNFKEKMRKDSVNTIINAPLVRPLIWDKDSLPSKFTFPFYYTPHPLAVYAIEELQTYLTDQTDFEHNFGLIEEQEGLVIGKMFGVLVVQDKDRNIGYLSAFSGKLGNSNDRTGFVPPVFDMLKEGSFYKRGEAIISQINERIEEIEQSDELKNARSYFESTRQLYADELTAIKVAHKKAKKDRKQARVLAEKELEPQDLQCFLDELVKESLENKFLLKGFTNRWEKKLDTAGKTLKVLNNELEGLKEERKSKSSKLQQQLFENYTFLNANGEHESLLNLFKDSPLGRPPAGAGECAAPKLLHYAYKHSLKPIAMAEFWWGASPASEIRKHKGIYPACKGKCEPILGHMLQGLDVDENPMLKNYGEDKELKKIFEDDVMLVINKPTELLSVPGRRVTDSVQSRIQEMYPDAEGPVIVHRLDMSTSGLMLIAKTKEAYIRLQSQFIKRTIKKNYIALLDGTVEGESGEIKLPMIVDFFDRPRQKVCFKEGKPAQTKWKVLSVENNRTRILFEPITGRTHQLRVHSAHSDGLNCPIVGDDLYGQKEDRLNLHAYSIDFEHPVSRERMNFKVEPEF